MRGSIRGWIRQGAMALLAPVAEIRWLMGQVGSMISSPSSPHLQVGCGQNRFEGWINADIVPWADAVVFIERRLPFASNSLETVYSEHVLEHVSAEQGLRFLEEVRRVLRPGGVVRIAMPDLDRIVADYQEDWKRQEWVHWPGHEGITSRGRMINACFRWWGHQYLYNREDLASALIAAGFAEVEAADWGQSRHPRLCGRETRAESLLIMEATKR